MKHTEADRRFAVEFAEALQPHVTIERNQGKSWAKIAARLGVTAAGLQKQLNGGTPSIRTIALAHGLYGIAVPYDGIDISKALAAKRKGRKGRMERRQLVLPFEITAPAPSKDMILKLLPQGVRRYRLQVTVGLSR
jgi:transcriptional regulator with XRE-family HTH domain